MDTEDHRAGLRVQSSFGGAHLGMFFYTLKSVFPHVFDEFLHFFVSFSNVFISLLNVFQVCLMFPYKKTLKAHKNTLQTFPNVPKYV